MFNLKILLFIQVLNVIAQKAFKPSWTCRQPEWNMISSSFICSSAFSLFSDHTLQAVSSRTQQSLLILRVPAQERSSVQRSGVFRPAVSPEEIPRRCGSQKKKKKDGQIFLLICPHDSCRRQWAKTECKEFD